MSNTKIKQATHTATTTATGSTHGKYSRSNDADESSLPPLLAPLLDDGQPEASEIREEE